MCESEMTGTERDWNYIFALTVPKFHLIFLSDDIVVAWISPQVKIELMSRSFS